MMVLGISDLRFMIVDLYCAICGEPCFGGFGTSFCFLFWRSDRKRRDKPVTIRAVLQLRRNERAERNEVEANESQLFINR